MRKLKKTTMMLVLMLVVSVIGLNAGDRKEIKKTFNKKQEIKIKLIQGDCVVKTGKADKIEVQVSFEPGAGKVEPTMVESEGALIISDKHAGSDSKWTIVVPGKTSVVASLVAGNFSADGLTGGLYAKTVAGDMMIKNCRGDLDFKGISGNVTAENLEGSVTVKSLSGDLKLKKLVGDLSVRTVSGSLETKELTGSITVKIDSGDVIIQQASGDFKIKNASGDIEATDISIKGESYFKVASGDISIKLSTAPQGDLTLAAASGNALLNYNGNPMKGLFQFKVLKDSGRVVSPFAFDKEEEIEEKWGKTYLLKSFSRGGSSPVIFLKTASGNAELREK